MKYSNNNIIVISNYLLLQKYVNINVKEVIKRSMQLSQNIYCFYKLILILVKFLKSTSSNLQDIFEYNLLYLYVGEDTLQITVVCNYF